MNSIYTWKYLKSRINIHSIADTFVHIINLTFFKTSYNLLRRPEKIRLQLAGQRELQGAFSFYLTSLIFVMIFSYISYFLFPESFEYIEPRPLDDFLQYIITLPFAVGIAIMNFFLFRKSQLNFLSNLIISLYIIGQSAIFLAFNFLFISAFNVLDAPMVQALIYVIIILFNLFTVNYNVYDRGFFSTLWKSLIAIFVSSIVMTIIAGFI